MQKDNIHYRLITDNIWQLMVKTSIPGMIGMLLVSLDSFIDALFIGRFVGPDALAGLSLVLPLTIITTGFKGLLASGFGSLLSRAIGANDFTIYKKLYPNLVAMVALLAILLSSLGYVFAGELVHLTGANNQLFKYGYDYYSTIILGSVFTLFAVSFGSLIRAQGNLKTATIFSGIAVCTNILFNYMLIVVLELGVKGAAISSVVSMALLAVCNGFYWMKKNQLSIHVLIPTFDLAIIKQVLVVGQAALVMQLLNFLRQLLIFKSAASLGTDKDVAVLGAIFRIFLLSVIPIFGMLQAMQPIVGVNFGAKKIERVHKTVFVFRTGGFLVLLTLCLPSLLFPEQVLSFFLPETVFEPYHFFHFRLVMFILPFTIFSSTGITLLQAVGKGKTTSILLFFRQLMVFLPIILVCLHFRGYKGIYEAIFLENICFSLIVSLLTFKYTQRV